MLPPTTELADLHIHVGGAVAPHILWSIAHDQGFKLPVSTYWEFRDLVTAGTCALTVVWATPGFASNASDLQAAVKRLVFNINITLFFY